MISDGCSFDGGNRVTAAGKIVCVRDSCNGGESEDVVSGFEVGSNVAGRICSGVGVILDTGSAGGMGAGVSDGLGSEDFSARNGVLATDKCADCGDRGAGTSGIFPGDDGLAR